MLVRERYLSCYLPGGGGGGGRLGLNHARMCVKWVLFWLQGNEMNDGMSFKMGVKFATSF